MTSTQTGAGCSIARSLGVLGEKWTILIVRVALWYAGECSNGWRTATTARERDCVTSSRVRVGCSKQCAPHFTRGAKPASQSS